MREAHGAAESKDPYTLDKHTNIRREFR